MYYFTEYESPVGILTLVSNDHAVCGLWFETHRYMYQTLGCEPVRNDSNPILKELASWLDAYFANKRPAIGDLSLEPSGSDFRQEVWHALCKIPYGETLTYGELSEEIKRIRGKASPRCIGGAVGHNPIGIVVPCHRVVGANGSLTGFGGGIDKKVALLSHEGVDMRKFFVPTKKTAL